MTSPKRILLVDDCHIILDCLKESICLQALTEDFEIELDCASSGHHAWEKIQTQHYDVIISDYQMPDGDGIWLYKNLAKHDPNPTFYLFTGSDNLSPVYFKDFGISQVFYKGKGLAPLIYSVFDLFRY